jgi:hypothetical protein
VTFRWAALSVLVVVAVTAAVSVPLAGRRPSVARSTATSTATAAPVPSTSTTTTTAPTSSRPPRLATIAFFNPKVGYGVFTTGSTKSCQVEVAMTSDGGEEFQPPVDVASCSALGNTPSLAFDDHDDGFLYSSTADTIYVTHDGGSTWSPEVETRDVLSVEALGNSIWMLSVECPTTSSSSGAIPTCQLSVRESTDGGRSWRTSTSQPAVTAPFVTASNGGGSMVRLSQSAAYVVGSPTGYGGVTPSTVPIWYTDDGGATWSLRDLSCGIGAQGAVSVSAAPTGTTLYGACGGEPGLGNQTKSIVVSGNKGVTWSHPGTCTHSIFDWCATGGIFAGYLGQVEAVSATTAFIFGSRSSIRVTTDGGKTWTDAGSYSTLVSSVIFFSPYVGVASGLSPHEHPNIWHTDDGGASWTLLTPVIQQS